MDPLKTPEQIYEIARSFMPARIILTAHELGVFMQLRESPCTSEEVARSLQCHPRGIDRLLCALVALGLVHKSAGKYSLAPVARDALLPEGKAFLAGLDHVCQMWESWSTLTQAVRHGGKVDDLPITARDRGYFEKFIRAMHANAHPRARRVAALLPIDPPHRIVDLGGGSGAYAAAFAERWPEAEVILFDLPQVVEIAPRYLREEPHGFRVQLRAGDMFSDELPAPTQFIWLSAIIHMFSPAQNLALLERCARACAPGGTVAIQDFVMSEDRTQPPHGAIFALNMLVAREWGDTYTESDIRGWMAAAGLHHVQRLDTPFGTAIMLGEK